MAQNRREQIEHRRIHVGETGDRPRQGGAGEFDRLKAMRGPGRQLEGLRRHEHGREPRTWCGTKVLGDSGARFFQINVADNDDHEIVRHVACAVIVEKIVARDGRKHIAMADDRLTEGMFAKGGGKERVPQPVVRVVARHRDLAEDDLALLRNLGGRQRRMEHGVGEHVDRDGGMLARKINVVNGAVERRVGVDVAAVGLHGRRNFPTGAARRALEQHVLDKVRKARAEIFSLVDTAGLDPHLHRCERRRAIGFKDQREAVGQDGALDGLAPKRIEQAEIGSGGRQLGHDIFNVARE